MKVNSHFVNLSVLIILFISFTSSFFGSAETHANPIPIPEKMLIFTLIELGLNLFFLLLFTFIITYYYHRVERWEGSVSRRYLGRMLGLVKKNMVGKLGILF